VLQLNSSATVKAPFRLFRRRGIYYSEDTETGEQKSLGTADKNTAHRLSHAHSESAQMGRHRFAPRRYSLLSLLYTAYTGQRTCEVLKLRIKAAPDEPGSMMEDGKCLRVWRAKGQHIVNPFCSVHDGLEALIAAHKEWITQRYPASTWFFPGLEAMTW
jgi:hypothetical protein